MHELSDLQLSGELQELYLENKEWLSQLEFLKDEHRFFTKIFNAEEVKSNSLEIERVVAIENKLLIFKLKLENLQQLAQANQYTIEGLLTSRAHTICLDLIAQNTTVNKEVKLLLERSISIKKTLFALIERD